jgi:hypothetical protein
MKLEVITTDSVIGDRYARVENRDATHLDWEETYVSFSGFFGNHGPHVFAAAPALYEVAKAAECFCDENGMINGVNVRAALSKARGEQ